MSPRKWPWSAKESDQVKMEMSVYYVTMSVRMPRVDWQSKGMVEVMMSLDVEAVTKETAIAKATQMIVPVGAKVLRADVVFSQMRTIDVKTELVPAYTQGGWRPANG